MEIVGVSLVGIGAIVFIQGGWLPLIPALLALVGTATGMSLYQKSAVESFYRMGNRE